MKDTKFILTLSILLLLNFIALYILNFVSFKEPEKRSDFLIKLSKIESGFEDIDFYKKTNKFLRPVLTKKVEKKKQTLKVVIVKNKKKTIQQKAYSKIKKSVDIYKRLIVKFKRTNDFKIALKLSRLYYMKKKYKKSLKWAMIANELNDKDDGSWILFAKSKIKLGDKNIAKKALLTYSKVYYSKSVQELLNRISI